MAIIKPTPPDDVRKAFVDGMVSMTDSPTATRTVVNVRNAIMGGASAEQDAHPVFTLGLQDLVGGGGLNAVRPAGWRFLASDVSGGAAGGEVMQPPGGGAPAMTRLAHGEPVRQILSGAIAIESLPEAQTGDYEMRALEIPALPLQAFWLQSKNGGTDLIVPVRSLAPQLENMHAYPADEFLRIAQELAARRLQFNDEPRTDQ